MRSLQTTKKFPKFEPRDHKKNRDFAFRLFSRLFFAMSAGFFIVIRQDHRRDAVLR